MKRNSIITIAVLIALALLIVLLAACTTSTSTDEHVERATFQVGAPCDELDGKQTKEIIALGTCHEPNPPDNKIHIMALASYPCVDSRVLYWNDFGWGYNDATWHKHTRLDGQLVPPEGEFTLCTGEIQQ